MPFRHLKTQLRRCHEYRSLTFAATDTTSTALARTLHLLSQHKEAQDHLRQELKEAKKGNSGKDLSYNTLVSLPYLDAVCRETLRLSVTTLPILKHLLTSLAGIRQYPLSYGRKLYDFTPGVLFCLQLGVQCSGRYHSTPVYPH